MAADRNLLLRVASAAVGLPLVGALVLWRQPIGFALLCLVAAAVALGEYTTITLGSHPLFERAAIALVGVGFGVAVYLRPSLAPAWAMIAVTLVSGLALARPRDVQEAARTVIAGGFGIFYVGGLLVALPLLHREAPSGRLWVVVAVAVTFASDTGAYFVGRALGRHKLAPLVSPGKTVEGALGGLGAALLLMVVARATFFPALTWRDCALVGLAAGVLGPIGDLTESLLKRAGGVKDSGRLIPGHGGVLDRIDAILFVAAYVYVHVRLVR
jgi:phosphatidate cytidylyltransferase